MKYNLTINPPQCYWPKKERSQQKWPNPKYKNIIGICSYCVLDSPWFEWNQALLHPELTPWWSFLFANGAHHKKPHSPTHPSVHYKKTCVHMMIYNVPMICNYDILYHFVLWKVIFADIHFSHAGISPDNVLFFRWKGCTLGNYSHTSWQRT